MQLMEQATSETPKTRIVLSRMQIFWGGMAMLVVGVVGIAVLVGTKPSPLEIIKRNFGIDYTQYPSREFPTRAVNSYVEHGVTHVAFTESPCSGVSCGSIICFDVYTNGQVAQTGQDSGPVVGYSAPPQYDYVNCSIINKMIAEEPPIEPSVEIPRSIVISQAPSERYLLRYDYSWVDVSQLYLITPEKAIELSDIRDANVREEQIIWAEKTGNLYMSAINYARNEGPVTQLYMISLSTGNVTTVTQIPNGFYGAAHDFAFPLVLSPDGKKIVVQSDYYRTFRVYDLSLKLLQTVNTQWAQVEPFSDGMYQIPGYSMELLYDWKDNTTIEYQFKGDGAKIYTVTVN